MLTNWSFGLDCTYAMRISPNLQIAPRFGLVSMIRGHQMMPTTDIWRGETLLIVRGRCHSWGSRTLPPTAASRRAYP